MSGRINLSNLSDSLKEHLNSLGLTEEQVNELIESALVEINEKNVEQDEVVNGLVDKVGELNGLMTEEKGDLVGAINELFQSANNGKELIANAIGEPLDGNDTFSAMSNDINGLLSTFKTNMMINGITVESSDRFKQLIDKIATMVEEGEGKGIQFASGSVYPDHNNSNSDGKTTDSIIYYKFDSKLNFTPSHFFVIIDGYYNNGIILLTNLQNYELGGISLNTVTSDGITVNNPYGEEVWVPAGSYNGSYYAFGVGEEDTTLRDSLASILTEEGVSVTEEDDMTSLITKVDEEFDRQVVPAGTAVASNVLSGKTFINSTGQTITGTMANRGGAQTVTPGTSNKTLNAGYYSGNITVAGDANLIAANIVSGKSIFGISGSATTFVTGTATPNGTKVSDQVYFTRLGETQSTERASYMDIPITSTPKFVLCLNPISSVICNFVLFTPEEVICGSLGATTSGTMNSASVGRFEADSKVIQSNYLRLPVVYGNPYGGQHTYYMMY